MLYVRAYTPIISSFLSNRCPLTNSISFAIRRFQKERIGASADSPSSCTGFRGKSVKQEHPNTHIDGEVLRCPGSSIRSMAKERQTHSFPSTTVWKSERPLEAVTAILFRHPLQATFVMSMATTQGYCPPWSPYSIWSPRVWFPLI